MKPQEIETWNALASKYPEKVYSITATPEKRAHIIEKIRDGEKILIIGCGSEVYLQKDLLERYPHLTIFATDISPEMLRVAQEKFSHPQLHYLNLDSTNLTTDHKDFGDFNAVISTNSILPESRDEVAQMYNEIYNVLKPGGRFLAFMPSFEFAEFVERNQLMEGIDKIMDRVGFRVKDTVGYQCFHTRKSLKEELFHSGFRDISVTTIGVESMEEYLALRRTYHSYPMAAEFWEFKVEAKKNGHTWSSLQSERRTPKHIDILPDGRYQVETYTSHEMHPQVIREVSDYYCYMFNNNGHYLVFPESFRFISPQEFFGREDYVSLAEMYSVKELPRDPETGEQAVFWHHPKITSTIITEKLLNNAHLALLRDRDTHQISGFAFGYQSTAYDMFIQEGWENPFYYAGIKPPQHQRNFNDFLRKVRRAILNNTNRFPKFARGDEFFGPGSKVYAWNCVGKSPEVKGKRYFWDIMRNFFAIIPDNTKEQCLEFGDARFQSRGYEIFKSAGFIDVPGVFLPEDKELEKGDSILVMTSLSEASSFFSRSFIENTEKPSSSRKIQYGTTT